MTRLGWRALGYAFVAVLVATLAAQYARALGPAARRERASACAALKPALRHPRLGRFPLAAPPIQAQDYTGKQVPLSAYAGRVVFLNFWAPWCPPCIEEMPSMEALQADLTGEPFTVLALASEPTWPKVREFFPTGTNMTVLLDPPEEEGTVGKLAEAYGTDKLPETYLIDKQGNIRYYFVNKRDWGSPAALRCIRSLIDE